MVEPNDEPLGVLRDRPRDSPSHAAAFEAPPSLPLWARQGVPAPRPPKEKESDSLDHGPQNCFSQFPCEANSTE